MSFGNKTASVHSEKKILYSIVILPPCGEEMYPNMCKNSYVLDRQSQNQYIVNIAEIKNLKNAILIEGNLY